MAHKTQCRHTVLQFDPSSFAKLAGFERPDGVARLSATKNHGYLANRHHRLPKENEQVIRTFPAPLVLPHDDLNYDPDCAAQSFHDWLSEEARNKVTENRKAIYVATVPAIDRKVGYMREWLRPSVRGGGEVRERTKKRKTTLDQDLPEDVRFGEKDVTEVFEYLEGFYHGMEVKELPVKLRWAQWKGGSTRPRGIPKYLALQNGDQATRIRARPAPDGMFPAQLNLDDILDAEIAMLPEDAHSIVLLVEHDMYESADDDFCCGRAYGGSRICVVQTARYNPLLDRKGGIDYAHLWPMSHCKDHVDKLCAVEDVEAQPATKKQITLGEKGPLRAAVDAASSLKLPDTPEALQAMWVSRVARTVSHELGHCLGMDHCVYYACNMQGTAGMEEDGRQPPYLCPVCLMKMSYGVAVERDVGKEAAARKPPRMKYVAERYRALSRYCEKRQDVVMWRALGAWIEAVLEGMNGLSIPVGEL